MGAPPEIRPVNLGSNDRASILVMPLCGYQVEEIRWRGGNGVPLVKVSTESSDPKYRGLMDMTFRDVGLPNANQSKPGILLDYGTFECITNPLDFLTPKFLNSRYTYSAFLFTLLFLRLSPQEHRLAFSGVKDPILKEREDRLLELANNQYKALALRLDRDDKPLALGRYRARTEREPSYIEVTRPEEVIAGLLKEPGVQRLRIFRRGREDSVTPFGGPTEIDPDLAGLMRNFIVDAQEIAAENERVRREATEFFVGSR